MECQQNPISNKEFLQRVQQKVIAQRIPFSGTIALTDRCNLRCVHCYLGDKHDVSTSHKKEMDSKRWHAVLDEITEAGCLFLTITGGEPLLRNDFEEIYRHAKTNGLLVTVFTNATLINDSHLDTFQAFSPSHVDVSIYGATAETYAAVTGSASAYQQCIQGIERLLERNISVSLKTILMTLNRHEFHDIERLAETYNTKFRFDATIIPCFDRTPTPLQYRVPPEEAVEVDFSKESRVQAWKTFFHRKPRFSVLDGPLYQCGSGQCMFYINPYGRLQPCMMVNAPCYNLSNGTFSVGWSDVLPDIKERVFTQPSPCIGCDKAGFCGYCPAEFALETGREDCPSEYFCALGHQRFETIQRLINSEEVI